MGQSQLLKEAIDSVNRCAIRRVVQGASHGNRGTFPWTSQPIQETTVDFLNKFLK
jgi:hypothetical protein